MANRSNILPRLRAKLVAVIVFTIHLLKLSL